MRLLYTIAAYLSIPWALLHLWLRGRRQPGYRAHLGERFGFYAGSPPDAPVIWIHAVSVGEARAAEPIVNQLLQRRPDHRIVMTHMTPTGRDTARELFADSRVSICYLPYDLPGAVRRFLRHFHPHAGIIMETELWPNLLAACARDAIPAYLVNARLSERSASGYRMFSRLTRVMLGRLAAVGAQTERDAQRLRSIGARNVVVTGNVKFDRTPPVAQVELGEKLRASFGGTRPVFLAASTRDGEEVLLLQTIAQLSGQGVLTLIVPRHPQRFDEVAALLRAHGVPFHRRSERSAIAPDVPVLLGDSMGEMYAYYGACDVAFVGGSLLPLGGQNLLEACVMGKPVLVGPHTFNFEEATERAIEAGAALKVADISELTRTAVALLVDPRRARRMGEAGRSFAETHRGATERTLALIGV
jgi:3-deoxy-D-manno-octulosonic-acid transferase